MAKPMTRLLLIFLSVVSLSNPASAITESQRGRLDQFAQKILEKKKTAVGYPVNQDTSLRDFYAWYMKHEMYRVAMNNVGDPYKQSPYTLNTHEFEQEVVNYFARLVWVQGGRLLGFRNRQRNRWKQPRNLFRA
jgi:histidine decarboxylase